MYFSLVTMSSDFFQLQLHTNNSLHDSWSKFRRRLFHSPRKKTWSFFPMVFQLWRLFWGNQSKLVGGFNIGMTSPSRGKPKRYLKPAPRKTPVQIACDNIIMPPMTSRRPLRLPKYFFSTCFLPKKLREKFNTWFPHYSKQNAPSWTTPHKFQGKNAMPDLFVLIFFFDTFVCWHHQTLCLCHSQNPNIDPLPDVHVATVQQISEKKHWNFELLWICCWNPGALKMFCLQWVCIVQSCPIYI